MTKKKNITDAIARDLPRLDKAYYKPGDYPGLELWIYPSGKKTWRFQYRTKNKKYPIRIKIGNYPHVGVIESIKRAKEEAKKIYEGGDPKETVKKDILKMQLGEALRKYYQEELTTINNLARS